MLAIDRKDDVRRLTPNLLPCTIHHSGSLKVHKRYWSPSRDADGKTSTSYLRGRKLKGRTVKLPDGYQGYLLQKTDKDATATSKPGVPAVPLEEDDDEMDEEDEKPEGVKLMEQKGVFDEFVVWNHEIAPEDTDDHVKGVEEWIAFAEAIHCEPDSAPTAETT